MTSDQPVEGKGDPNMPGLRAQRVFVLGFMIFFIGSLLGVFFFGNSVVARAKSSAAETDVALKSLAWAVLLSTAEEGRFPVKPSDLDGVAITPPVPPIFEDGELPASLDEVLEGESPMAPEEALDVLVVEWPPDGTLPPVLTTGGRPSGIGTLAEVNGWLVTAARNLPSPANGD